MLPALRRLGQLTGPIIAHTAKVPDVGRPEALPIREEGSVRANQVPGPATSRARAALLTSGEREGAYGASRVTVRPAEALPPIGRPTEGPKGARARLPKAPLGVVAGAPRSACPRP